MIAVQGEWAGVIIYIAFYSAVLPYNEDIETDATMK